MNDTDFATTHFFHQEKNPIRLWVPQDSEFVRDTEWMFEKFDQSLRLENMILTANNILEPEILAKVFILSFFILLQQKYTI